MALLLFYHTHKSGYLYKKLTSFTTHPIISFSCLYKISPKLWAVSVHVLNIVHTHTHMLLVLRLPEHSALGRAAHGHYYVDI